MGILHAGSEVPGNLSRELAPHGASEALRLCIGENRAWRGRFTFFWDRRVDVDLLGQEADGAFTGTAIAVEEAT